MKAPRQGRKGLAAALPFPHNPRTLRNVIPFILCFTTVACDKAPTEPTTSSLPRVTSSVPSAPPGRPLPGTPAIDITWSEPEGMEKAPQKSAMRAASYRVPPAEGDTEAGDLGVFYFGAGQGGGIEPNMKRWVDEFPGVKDAEVRRSQRTANGLLQHVVEIDDGTFQSGMPGKARTPKSGFALTGVIVEAPSGNYFFKLTGPKKTVVQARDAFAKMMASVAVK